MTSPGRFRRRGSAGCSAAPPTVVGPAGEHCGVLNGHGVVELVAAIRALGRTAGER
ncbi:hypothetical protein ACWCXH_22375 [Kitasatospora sp. NPDC001660]